MMTAEKITTCVAMRGRNPDNPSDRRTGIETEQVLEIKEDVVTNTLTSVQKDNLLLEQVAIIDDIYHSRDERVYTEVSPALRAERDGLKVIKIQEEVLDELKDWVWEVDGQKYLIRLRKLTPRESWRLMDFSDEEFDKAAEVNSNTQLTKQAGNTIVKNVLCEVFKSLLDQQ